METAKLQIKSLLGRCILDTGGESQPSSKCFHPLCFSCLFVFLATSLLSPLFSPRTRLHLFSSCFVAIFYGLPLRSPLFFLRFSISVYSEPDKIAQRNFRKFNDRRHFLAHFQTTFPGSALAEKFLSTAYSRQVEKRDEIHFREMKFSL